MSSQKGKRAEWELSDTLEDTYDYAAMPAGGSGSGTQRPRPDIFAVRGVRLKTPRDGLQDYSNAFAIEVKARDKGVATFSSEEIDELREFASRAGATSLVAIRPDMRKFDSWYLLNVDDLHTTPEGNYSVRKQDHADCLSIPEVFGP